jgi:hypothetical protein
LHDEILRDCGLIRPYNPRGQQTEGAMTADELRERLAALEARRDTLRAECMDLAARLPEIRAAFGNPFFYSRPTEPDEGKANYTGHRSQDVGLPTLLDLIEVEREVARLKSELCSLEL